MSRLEAGRASRGGPASSRTLSPSLFSAIQSQLGLKLEAARAPVDFIVIERVEKPNAEHSAPGGPIHPSVQLRHYLNSGFRRSPVRLLIGIVVAFHLTFPDLLHDDAIPA